MMLPVSSMTTMPSSEACSIVLRMISPTLASDSGRSIVSPIAEAMISSAAFSSSAQSLSTRQSLMASVPQRCPCAKTATERKDLIFCFSKSWRKKPASSRVWPAKILPWRTSSARRSSNGSSLTIDWTIRVGGSLFDAVVDPVGGDGLGKPLAGHVAEPEQDRPVGIQSVRQLGSTVADLGLPVINSRSRRRMRAVITDRPGFSK